MSYKLSKLLTGEVNNIVIRDNGAQIPFDPANTDYQAYLKWLAEGNTPLPPDQE
jgi:hypothetical protein